jgi:hypothetical protein
MPRAGRARAGSPCPPADHLRAAAAGWLQLLPLLFFLLYSLLSQTSSPVALLRPEREYRDMLRTVTHSVPFYVRDADSFESRFPEGGAQRLHLEKQVRACVLRAACCCCAARASIAGKVRTVVVYTVSLLIPIQITS